MSTTSLPITGLDGGRIQLDAPVLEAFARDLEGSVLRPDDEAYAQSVSLWNGMIAKRPAIVVRAASVDDVVRTVRFAAEHGIELSIRGGGHNIAGLALCDGGMTLDMSGRNAVEVDPGARLARVQAGALLGDVDRATQQHGLVATLGFVSLTGVAGLTLGGGFGYLTRRFGWTVDDLEEVSSRPCRRLSHSRIARRERRPVLGPSWRRRQLRGRHGVHVPPARGRAADHRRTDRVAGLGG